MKVVFNTRDELRKIQNKYPSPKSMRKHAEELIAIYGESYFHLLIQEAERIQREIKNNEATVKIELQALQARYEKGERYDFVVTGRIDEKGHTIVRDSSGVEHSLLCDTLYKAGDEVRCTVSSYSTTVGERIADCHLVLISPRIIKQEEPIRYLKSPDKWYGEVQDLGKHKCGKPFKCSCCGGEFPANSGWRVDLREIYFCNACAKKIYEPKGRGNRRFIISTPMGNKR